MNTKQELEIAVSDWMADHAEECTDLILEEAHQDEDGCWIMGAHDDHCDYILTLCGGDVQLIYIGTK